MADEEVEPRVLTTDMVSESLSQIARTVDGSSFAFVKLDIANKELTSLGDALDGFPHLRYVTAVKNHLKDVSVTAKMGSLLALDVRENRVEALPAFENPYLQVVNASKNQISSLEGLQGPAITMLNVDDNKLQSLDGVGALGELMKLEARRNEIASTKSIGTCASLRELYLEENKLEALEEVEELKALERIVLTGNQIKDLTPLEGLETLREIHLGGNAVESMDEVKRLVGLPNLRVVDFSECPVAGEGNLRQELLILMPYLTKIDGEKVTKEELEEMREVVKEREAAAAAGDEEEEDE